MSGQPVKNATDAEKFRRQYMDNLNLRAKLDEIDLQANKLYKRTGQIPVELSDFRTTNERLADIQNLKVEARSKLLEIADGQEANKIAQSLSDNELLFYSQSAEEINKILKPKYRFGIYAEIFIPFLQRYMNDTALSNGIIDGNQQTRSTKVGMNADNYARSLATAEQLTQFIKTVEDNLKRIEEQSYLRSAPYLNFKSGVENTIKLITGPTPSELIDDIYKIRDKAEQLDLLESMTKVYEDFPVKTIVENQLDRLIRIIAMKDLNAVTNALSQFTSKITPPTETESWLNILRSNTAKTIRGQTTSAPAPRPGQTGSPFRGKGFVGNGVVRKRLDVIIPDEDIDYSKGINITKRFAPLGRYIINTHRLDKDIIAIKRPSGSTLKAFPSEKVSTRLASVIRSIVGGAVPTFTDFDELDDIERSYLYKLALESNIADRLSIPAPNKNQVDKEIDEFEKMKGQIMAGNDNRDLVKSFKLLLIRLTKKNIIPKPQSKEIMEELAMLNL